MNRNMESSAKDMLGAAKSKGFDISKLSGIMDSAEGRALLRQLSGPGGDALKEAAARASEGDSGAVGRLMASLMSTNEGRALAKQIMEIANS